MQNYLIDPTPANLSSYVSLQRSFGITYQHPYLKKAIKTKLNYNDITAPSAMLSVKPPNEGLSITSQNRLKLISQIAMIIGDEFAFTEGGQIKSGEHWGSIYFDRGYRTVELVERVYLRKISACGSVLNPEVELTNFPRFFSDCNRLQTIIRRLWQSI